MDDSNENLFWESVKNNVDWGSWTKTLLSATEFTKTLNEDGTYTYTWRKKSFVQAICHCLGKRFVVGESENEQLLSALWKGEIATVHSIKVDGVSFFVELVKGDFGSDFKLKEGDWFNLEPVLNHYQKGEVSFQVSRIPRHSCKSSIVRLK